MGYQQARERSGPIKLTAEVSTLVTAWAARASRCSTLRAVATLPICWAMGAKVSFNVV
jgi:hypothetical protein